MSGADAVGIDWAALDGSLLLVKPKEFIPEMDTQFGTPSAVRADVVILDGPRAEESLEDVLVFPEVLLAQVGPTINSGGMVLGRLGRAKAQKNQPAPWALRAATEGDKTAGRTWLARRNPPPE